MGDVYNWIGSLQDDPQHFALLATIGTQMKTLMHPDEHITPNNAIYGRNQQPSTTGTTYTTTRNGTICTYATTRPTGTTSTNGTARITPAPPTLTPPLALPAPMAPRSSYRYHQHQRHHSYCQHQRHHSR